ncbi:RNA polymerase-associated protein [Sporobolomyces koalae]|uniref:RNA polymerase-associated protein n=1 Tax=Sporobolomyces koalae TaxID=500713 RepID=UPI00317822CB
MDIDDELLGLAEGGASKRKSKSSGRKSNKRRRPAESEDGSESDMDMSASDSDAASPPARSKKAAKSAPEVSDSDEEAAGDDGDLYPLEGIYKNSADRKYILGLPEFEREDIIATRKEEMHERQTRIEVAKMASRSFGGKSAGAASGEGGEDDEDDDDEEEYGNRGTRSRKATGTSTTKNEGLEKLKRRRAEKGKKREAMDSDSDGDYEAGGKSSSRRRGQSSDTESDPELSDVEETKQTTSKKKETKHADPAAFHEVMVPRSKLAEFCGAPWFEEWIKGAWVRLGVGMDKNTGQMAYRLCRVEGIRTGKARPYKIEPTSSSTTDIELNLRHADLVRHFTMETVSNAPFSDREFDRLSRTCKSLPTSKELSKIQDQLNKHKEYIMTEQDLAAQLAKKGRRPVGAAHKARLLVQRDHAFSSNDTETYERIVREIAELESATPTKENEQERMRRVNERNRASNREEIQKAEARSQEERRRQAASLAKGENVRVDPSARVKTMTRLTYDSRAGTPGSNTPAGATTPTKNGAQTPTLAASAARTKGNKIESVVASNVQLDLDLDF